MFKKIFSPKISVRIISQVAMLIAVAFILERMLPIVNLPTMRITLSFIPMMMCGMLFGPVWGAVAYGLSDVLGWFIMPLTPNYFILAARIVNGFLFGLILHRENLSIWSHSVISAVLTQVICAMGLTTLGLSIFYGQPYVPLLVSRLPQFGVYIILQIAIFPYLVNLRDALRKSGLIRE
ncbi:MAG: folate family ECF transporter S component [Oscillospiraceae bacterium]|nr:folate family ECF transporter S component [Oscillospiraceae bacterium]